MVVYLVGAGPGDADLITVKAVKILKKADVVLYDYLSNDEILNYAPDTAKKIFEQINTDKVSFDTLDKFLLSFQ